jgi:ABC-2 type transport system permease protein
MRRAIVIANVLMKNLVRSRSGLFFTILFPVILLLIFGSVFGEEKETYTLYVQNFDTIGRKPTELSKDFIDAINDTGVVKLVELERRVDAEEYIEEHPFVSCRVLVIPKGFEEKILRGESVEVKILGREGDPYVSLVENIVSRVAETYNIKLSGARVAINVSLESVGAEEVKRIDYYVPGVISAFIMTNGIIGVTTNVSEYRRSGTLKRLIASPLTKYEWILGNLIQQVILAFILALVMIAIGWIVFDFDKLPDTYSVLLIFLGAVTFCSIGILLGNVVKDVEAATGIGNSIAFPMMFLSGTFWPIEIMPDYLQTVAKFLPLYYLHNGLRSTMIYRDVESATQSFVILGILGLVFLVLAVKATKWRED